MGSLIGTSQDSGVEKLHDLGTYARCGLECHAYPRMQEMWALHKSSILKHLKENKKAPILLRATSFEVMCHFKAASIAKELSSDT